LLIYQKSDLSVGVILLPFIISIEIGKRRSDICFFGWDFGWGDMQAQNFSAVLKEIT